MRKLVQFSVVLYQKQKSRWSICSIRLLQDRFFFSKGNMLSSFYCKMKCCYTLYLESWIAISSLSYFKNGLCIFFLCVCLCDREKKQNKNIKQQQQQPSVLLTEVNFVMQDDMDTLMACRTSSLKHLTKVCKPYYSCYSCLEQTERVIEIFYSSSCVLVLSLLQLLLTSIRGIFFIPLAVVTQVLLRSNCSFMCFFFLIYQFNCYQCNIV